MEILHPLIVIALLVSSPERSTSAPVISPVPVVSNLGAADVGFIQVANDLWWGLEVTTDTSPYLLNSVTLLMGNAFANHGTFSVNIYNAGASSPGDLLPNGHLQGANPAIAGFYTYRPIAPLALMATTSYYLVVGVEPFGLGSGIGQFHWELANDPASGAWQVSNSLDLDQPLFGWSGNHTGGSPIFAIDASPVPEPSTLALWSVGAGFLCFSFRRKRVGRRVRGEVGERQSSREDRAPIGG